MNEILSEGCRCINYHYCAEYIDTGATVPVSDQMSFSEAIHILKRLDEEYQSHRETAELVGMKPVRESTQFRKVLNTIEALQAERDSLKESLTKAFRWMEEESRILNNTGRFHDPFCTLFLEIRKALSTPLDKTEEKV